MKRLERTFVTGCDKHTEWQLKWFLANFRKHNPISSIVFCDFGVSDEMLKWAEKNFDEIVYNNRFEREILKTIDCPRWVLKPFAMLEVDAHKKVWIDTDCEVLGNISGIFAHLVDGRITLAQDLPWSSRRREVWHNTGVFGVIGNPNVLHEWVHQCRMMAVPYSMGNVPIGDQDALHALAGQDPMHRMIYINDLPNIYNWLRIQLLDGQDSPKKLIMHWTGQKGNDEIRKKINWANKYT